MQMDDRSFVVGYDVGISRFQFMLLIFGFTVKKLVFGGSFVFVGGC